MIRDHPLVVAGGAALSAVSFIGTSAFLVYFLLDLQKTTADVIASTAEIRGEQEAIRKELALQTDDLEAIRQEQDEIEGRQLLIVSEVNRTFGEIAVDLGRVMQSLE